MPENEPRAYEPNHPDHRPRSLERKRQIEIRMQEIVEQLLKGEQV